MPILSRRLALSLLVLAAVRAHAQPPAPAQTDPESQKLLEQMARAHLALRSFRADLTVRSTSARREEITRAEIAILRPGRARVLVGSGASARLSVTDGERRAVRAGALLRTVKATGGDASIREALTAAEVFIAPIFAWLGTDPKATARLLPGKVLRLGRANDETLDGVVADVVVADVETPGGPARLSFAIGRDDRLLRRLSVTARRGAESFSLSEIYTDVRADPDLPASLFAVPAERPKPPKGKKP